MAKAALFKSYVSTAVSLVQTYDGVSPFADFIKKFFAANKKFGSRDRKHITQLCYSYYRCPSQVAGDAAQVWIQRYTIEERMVAALFLCAAEPTLLLGCLQPDWNNKAGLPIEDKLALLGFPFPGTAIFPWLDSLSEGINETAFSLAHLVQPDLFLRVRPGYAKQVTQKLDAASITYAQPVQDCIVLPNNTKIDDILVLNREVVVQDYSSQRTGLLLDIVKPIITNQQSPVAVWDCCAASGGKSILAHDILVNVRLTVSDVRASIIANLKQRFKAAGLTAYRAYEIDLTKPVPSSTSVKNARGFDLIIADVPCTGSGTWGRTPEQLHFFTPGSIDDYAFLQQQIIQNILPHVKPGGYLLYITCSVFKKENEAMVDFIHGHSTLRLIKKEVLIGYTHKADTMFAALFKADIPAAAQVCDAKDA